MIHPEATVDECMKKIGALEVKIERLREELHYSNITRELALKHRNYAEAEIERLRDDIKTEREGWERASGEIDRLRAALEPFSRNVDAVSLSKALGHIQREHLHNARRVLEEKK